MKPSALEMMAGFSPAQLEAWARYLESPFFRVPDKLQQLGRILQPYYPDFDHPSCSNEVLFQGLFPDEPGFDAQKMYDAWSQLRKCMLDFLIHDQISQPKPPRKSIQLQALAGIHADAEFGKNYQSESRRVGQALTDQQEALEQMLIAQVGAEWFAARQLREQDDSIETVIATTDRYYLLSRLKYTCEWMNRQFILPSDQQSTPPGAFPPPDQWPPQAFEDPLILMYRQVYEMLEQGDSQAFSVLVSELSRYGATISQEEATNLYAYAQNFCIRMVNKGNPEYLETLFDLYRSTLGIGLLTKGGEFDHRQYKNIVTVGLRLGRLDWVETFVETYREVVSADYQDNAYHFNLASLRYDQQRYGESLSLLQQVTIGDVYYQLSARAMILKIYFEQEEDEALEHVMDTFRMFLKRNKEIASYQRQIHLNLVGFTRKLHQLKSKRYRLSDEMIRQRLSSIRAQMLERKNVANLSWLLDQIEQLEPAAEKPV